MDSVRQLDTSQSKVTSMSQYEPVQGDTQFSVNNVFDGIQSTDARSCNCCGTVLKEGWIQVDLGDLHVLNHIVIRGRSDSKYYDCKRCLTILR